MKNIIYAIGLLTPVAGDPSLIISFINSGNAYQLRAEGRGDLYHSENYHIMQNMIDGIGKVELRKYRV